MLSRLDPPLYPGIKRKANDLISKYPLINAVVSGIQEGHVYADVSADVFFISTKSGFSLLSSPPGVPEFNASLFGFLKANHDIPNYIHMYSPAKSFQDYIEANWDKYKIRKRAQFRYYSKKVSYNYHNYLPEGHRIASIREADPDRLEEAFQLDFGRRFWNSREDFLSKAIGACILNDRNDPAAICYSACIVDGIAEMDTLVLSEYRGRKFMRIVSEPFLNMAISEGLTPHWDTFVSNTPSYVMAQKFGLKEVQEYDLLSLLLR